METYNIFENINNKYYGDFAKGDNMNNRIQIARDFANSINSKYIKRIILFGSVARGEDNEDSDIDILIVSDFGDIIEPLIADEVFKIVLDKEEFISAHVMPESKLNRLKSFTFLNNIEREGIILGWNRIFS